MADHDGLPEPHRRYLAAQRISMERRTLAFLAAEPVEVQVCNGVLSAWPLPRDAEFPVITRMTSDVDVPDTGGLVTGWISAVLQPDSGELAIVVGHGSEVIDVIDVMNGKTGGLGHDGLTRVRQPLCSPIHVQKAFEVTQAWVDGYFDAMPPDLKNTVATARLAVDACLDRINVHSFEKWRSHGSTSPGADREFARARDDHSLWHLFGGERRRFETFVALGILQRHDVLAPAMQAELLAAGWDVRETFEAAAGIATTSDFDMVDNRDGVCRCLV